MDITLNGHSGCSISVHEQNGYTFVRKKSSSIEYNARLKAQYEKQAGHKFSSLYVTPTITSGYDSKGLFFFDMQYLNGVTLAKYMYSISLEEIPPLASKLMYYNDSNPNYDPDAASIIRNKVDSVVEKILTETVIDNEKKELEPLILQSKRLINDYSWDHMIHSPCHGDFTLENLLITSDKKIYAIDFLDSFYDSWLIDIAKILQDVELGWSYRFSKIDENLSIRLIVLRNNIMSNIEKMQDGHVLINHIYRLLLLNILRIFPYTHDKETFMFLIERTKYLLSIIK